MRSVLHWWKRSPQQREARCRGGPAANSERPAGQRYSARLRELFAVFFVTTNIPRCGPGTSTVARPIRAPRATGAIIRAWTSAVSRSVARVPCGKFHVIFRRCVCLRVLAVVGVWFSIGTIRHRRWAPPLSYEVGPRIASAPPNGEVDEAFVRGEGYLVVVVDAATVVDPAVRRFDHPAAGLDDEAAAGFGPDTTSTVTPASVAAVVTACPV